MKHGPEQAVAKLRQIDVLLGEGKSISQACKEAGTWHLIPLAQGICGFKGDQDWRLKELQRENQRL